MSETNTNEQWPDRALTAAQQENRSNAAQMPVVRSGAMPTNFAELVDYAKFMSTARGAVGAHLNGNVGACLAIIEIAKQFDMPAYAVARQSYLVNNRIAFMGQFFLAIINKYAPLKERLKWRYAGKVEDRTRTITIYGTFKDEAEPREWTSPMLKDITPQNSPLWKTNPDHQLIYFGVRAWQTVNWPEGMLGIHTDDEAAAMDPETYVGADRAIDVTPGTDLRKRLQEHSATLDPNAKRDGFEAGFTEAHFTETSETETDKGKVSVDETIASGIAAATTPPPGDPAPAKPPKPRKKPKTAADWKKGMTAYIAASIDAETLKAEWNGDLTLRADLGVSTPDRDEVFVLYQDKLTELEGE